MMNPIKSFLSAGLRRFGLTLIIAISWMAAFSVQAQGGCTGITFEFEQFEPCKFRLKYQNSSECFSEIRVILAQGNFESFNVNSGAGFSVDVISPSELWIHHALGFMPLGNQGPLTFTLPFDLTTTVGIAFIDDCAQLGCELFPSPELQSCPDPMDASIGGVVYRECNGMPYSNQALLSGWTIQLYNEAKTELIREELSDANGQYRMYDLPKGVYWARYLPAPGWTPNVPPAGEYLVDLAASQQVDRNFGICPTCSCDDIELIVQQFPGTSDTSTYELNILNAGAGCFDFVQIQVDSGQLLNWNVLLTGWTVVQLGGNQIRLFPPTGQIIPTGSSLPLQFNIAGAGSHVIQTSTSYVGFGGATQCVKAPFNYPSPPPVIVRHCCPTGTPGPEMVQNGDFSIVSPPGTNYTWVGAGTLAAGQISIMNQTQAYNSNNQWVCPGIPTANDNYLAVDGVANLAAWRQQITGIQALKEYAFCAYVNNLVRPNSNFAVPQVELYLENASNQIVATTGAIALPEIPNSWMLISANWTAPAPSNLSASYTLKIRTLSNAGTGNDFAVDKISFRECVPPPPCACPPNAFDNMSYKQHSGPNVPISCGQVAIWQCQYPTFNLGGNFMCQGTNCPSMPPISWTLTHPNLGQVDQGPASGTGFLISIPNSSFPASGLYTLLLKGICGEDTCYCEILIETPGCGNSCTADFSGNIDPCGKGTFQGFANGVAPFTYCWDFDGNLATCESTLPNPMYQFPAGVHTVTLKITDAVGCMATYSATFTVPPYPTSVTITGNANICQGQSTVLTAGGWNWTSCQWSNAASGATTTVNAPGTYCVTCVDANGCTASACYTVSQLPPPQVNVSGNLNICLGQSTTLTATGGGSYSWAPGGQTTAAITVSPNVTTTYTVTVTGTNGCTATKTVTVNVNALPAADAGPGQTICQWQQATLTASGGVSYQWSPNGSTANPYVTPPVQGHTTYTVTVTGANGCTATDVVKVITIVCDCDVNPFVQNGEFTNGNPCLAGDEDIQNATNWNGAWTTVGYSTGDFFNATTCTPSTVSVSLANPAPLSVGNFAGFWCFPHSTNVVWREGIMNNLSTANPITPNSGTYMVSMKMACLTNVNGAPRMSVYGVLSGATSTITGANPLTPFTPANTNLFQLGTNPSAAVLLGTVFVPSNCNNNFTDVGISFNSSILPGPIDRIFLTRDDPAGSNNSNPGGSVYLAVDSICLKPVLDTTACDCGPLDFAYVWQQSTNWYHSIGAAQAALTIPCPKQNATYSFFGAYHCAPDQCGNNQISWKLDRPGVLSDLTGQNTYVAYPFFHVPLNPADFSQAGTYQLTVSRMCGTKECSKVFNVKIDNCPCVCDSLRHDIGYGFSMSNVLFPLNNCKKRFRPLALCQNDQVSWTVSEVNGPFTSSGTSVGNASFQFPLSFPHSGYYTVCMTVVRTVNGQVCNTMQYCRTVYVHCGIDPITDVTRFCDENLIRNGGFRLGGSFGLLNEGSYLENWDAAPNPGDGQVAVDTSDGGSLDEGYVVLRGRAGNFAGIMQEVHLTKDNYIILHMDAINYLGEEAPAGTRIEVRLQKEPLIYPGQQSQILYTEMLVDTNGWRQIGRAIELPNLDTSLHYLVICLQNDDDLRNSIVGLDNIELCASATSPAPEAPQAAMQMRILPNPNPGIFTVELPASAQPGMSLRVVDVAGRLLLELEPSAGEVYQQIVAPQLPDGLYFLQWTDQGKVLGVGRFVKN